MDVLLFGGQSNMQGQTASMPEGKAVKNAYEYRFLEDKLIPLRHPVGETIGDLLLAAHEGKGSLVPAFCKAYTEKTGKSVAAVHIAKGATTVDEWLPEHPSGRYRTAVRKAQAAIRAAKDPDKIYFIWLQGESDAIEGTELSDYKVKMRYLREDLVNDLKIDGFYIIRVGKFVNDERDITIIRAQEELCKENGFGLLTRLTGYLTQNAEYMNPYAAGHYNNAGMELLGQRAGENLARIRKGMNVSLEEEPYEEMKKWN